MASAHYWRVVLVVVPAVGAAIATVSFLLRFYSRAFLVKHLDAGDLLMTLGLIFCYGVTTSTMLGELQPVDPQVAFSDVIF